MTGTLGFPRALAMPPIGSWTRRRETATYSQRGMVGAAHPLISAAGLREFDRGGNAVDAAVCAGLVAAVVMPEMCGLGGDLFAIVHRPARNGPSETLAVLGSGIAPRGAGIDLMREHGDDGGRLMPTRGPLSVSVPGMPDAYRALLERFGTRSFADVADPAVGYAADGFPLTRHGAAAIENSADLLRRFPSSVAVFLPDGRAPRAGTVLRQPDLGQTLTRLAQHGTDDFYRGQIAQRIADFMAESGGALTVDDFADHTTEIAPPLTTTYRGYQVHTPGIPAQGLILLEALNIAEQADFRQIGVDSATAVHLLVEAKKLAYADRLAEAGDPAFVDTPIGRLLSKEWATSRFAEINPGRAADEVAIPSYAHGDTTYLCVVDADGMMVSLIQSVSSNFGSGIVAGDTGIVLNNRCGRGFSLDDRHPNRYEPGKKTMSTLHCWMIEAPDGTGLVVGGTPGGDGQPQWNLQTIVGLIDGGLDAQAATELPRWTSWPGTDPATLPNPFELRIEDRFGDEVIEELDRRGHRLKRLGPWSAGGATQVIARDPDTGVLAGGSDPRAEGVALGI